MKELLICLEIFCSIAKYLKLAQLLMKELVSDEISI